MNAFDRTTLLIGPENIERLARAHVVVFGLGGVGSYAAETLARAPIGHLTLVDRDRFTLTNLNRQLHATHETLGRPKAEVVAERIRSINPHAQVRALTTAVSATSTEQILTGAIDYVIDAIDETSAKAAIVVCCKSQGIPVLSSMGAARKVDLSAIRVRDIAETRNCPLARRFRKLLRRQGIANGVKVVYSEEMPVVDRQDPGAADLLEESCESRADGLLDKRPQGTISYLPAAFGLHCAATVITELICMTEIRRTGQH